MDGEKKVRQLLEGKPGGRKKWNTYIKVDDVELDLRKWI
jgi:hypothetical protein